MNAKKAKAIRRIIRRTETESGETFTVHPRLYVNVQGVTMLKFIFQYWVTGAKKVYRQYKKFYRRHGYIPE